MKQITLIFLAVSIIGILISCDNSNEIECIRVSSSTTSETRDVKDFKGVVMNTVGILRITQEPAYSFKIEGPENIVELTTTEVQNGYLIIGNDNCFNGEYNLVIEVSSPTYELIGLTGIGDIETMNTIEGDIIEVEMLGIGTIDAQFYADSLYTLVTGQANVFYSGEVEKHTFESAGQFNYKGFPLVTNQTVIDLSGTGDCEVTANESLDVTISGEGNVYYKGTAQVNSSISGTGEVIDQN